jgi:hypothetical protein
MTPFIRKLFGSSALAKSHVHRKHNSRPQLESLEDRTLPTAVLDLLGSQSLVAGPNVNASNNRFTAESGMQVAINPANPLQVVGFTNDANNSNEMSIFRSSDGGSSWSPTILTAYYSYPGYHPMNYDGLGSGQRSNPTVQFDADGHLFIAYEMDNGTTTTLVTARSDDGGATFSQFRFPASNDDLGSVPGLNKPLLATGLDPTTGRQAVYIAYTRNSTAFFSGDHQEIMVVGSNDGGATFTAPRNIVDDDDANIFAAPAVGPNGELYVVWHDLDNGKIMLDHDLDGLWGQAAGFGEDVVVRDLRENLISKQTPASPGGGFLNGPSIDVNRGFGTPFYGRVYVTFTDGSGINGGGNDTDVFLMTSDDKGDTWNLPNSILGNGNVEASGGTDFMATVAVDPTSGSVNVGYYSSGADLLTGNDDVNFRVASSTDGGATWVHANLSSATSRAGAIRTTEAADLGHYVGLAAYGGTVHGFWTDNRGLSADPEAFTATASFQSATAANTLHVTGTGGPDTIEIRQSAVNPDYLEVIVNGRNEFTGLSASLNGIIVHGFGGNDRFVIGQMPAGVPVTVSGDDGSDTLVASGTWTITAANEGTVGNVTFGSVENLTGGDDTDVFVFANSTSAVTGLINGGGGSNWLDYVDYPGAVSVQLANLPPLTPSVSNPGAFNRVVYTFVGSATATGGVADIQNVLGSRTAANTLTGNSDPLGNILVGGDAADTITAGATRSILIGGRGADVVTGGIADDIVIAGPTDYDGNMLVLQTIMAEWRNPADDAATRVAKLHDGHPPAFFYLLVGGDSGTTTVHDDGEADTLRGDPDGSTTTGADWFFARLDTGTVDTILDRQGSDFTEALAQPGAAASAASVAPPPALTARVVKLKGQSLVQVFAAGTGVVHRTLKPFGKNARKLQVNLIDVNGDGIAELVVTARVHGKLCKKVYGASDLSA